MRLRLKIGFGGRSGEKHVGGKGERVCDKVSMTGAADSEAVLRANESGGKGGDQSLGDR